MSLENKVIKDFPVTIYGNLEAYSPVISKGRCRIFYKGGNRNGTFITDEFAEKLLSTIPYTPVKGIFDNESDDYSDHGESRDKGRIYGIVPAEPNLKWEMHQDEDGVDREYACVDVYLYTGLYNEASQIVGKAQSMELYAQSIQGDWKIINGKRYYVFEDACFLGLQVLGEDVEPCFEGAAFYTLYKSLKDVVDKLEIAHNNFQQMEQGGKIMPHNLYKLSDSQKERALWDLINSEVDSDGYRIFKYGVVNVYDEYAVVINYEDLTHERVYYTKNDETDSLEITNREVCYIIDVTEEEKKALQAFHAANGGTYAHIDQQLTEIANLNEKISDYGTQVEELQINLATLTTERDDAHAQLDEVREQYSSLNAQLEEVQAQYTAIQETVSALTAERDSLAAYKKHIEDDSKFALINSYSDNLPIEVIESYRASIDNYSIEDLDIKLTYEVKKAHPNMFKTNSVPGYVPKDDTLSGINAILAKYEKN